MLHLSWATALLIFVSQNPQVHRPVKQSNNLLGQVVSNTATIVHGSDSILLVTCTRLRVGKHLPQHRIHGQLGRTLALSTYPRPVPTCTYLMPLGLNTSSVGWNLQPEPPSCIHRQRICNARFVTTSLFWHNTLCVVL